MHRRLTRSLFVVAASLSVVAVGCGVSPGGQGGSGAQSVSAGWGAPVSAASLARSAETTSAVTSEKIHMESTTSGLGEGSDLTLTVDGAVDAKAKRGHLTTSFAGDSGLLADAADMEAIYDGDTAYLHSGLFETFGEGKPWIKVTSSRLGKVAGKLDGSVQSDPGAFVDFLKGAGTVKELGTEEVRGVKTRHISAKLDVRKALDRVDDTRRKKLEQSFEQLGGSLDALTAIPAEAWIDEDGYVRRFTLTLDVGAAAPGSSGLKGAKVTQTIELYDFNQPVDIKVPKASEVSTLDLEKILGD